jgi:hypothetical protein
MSIAEDAYNNQLQDTIAALFAINSLKISNWTSLKIITLIP